MLNRKLKDVHVSVLLFYQSGIGFILAGILALIMDYGYLNLKFMVFENKMAYFWILLGALCDWIAMLSHITAH